MQRSTQNIIVALLLLLFGQHVVGKSLHYFVSHHSKDHVVISADTTVSSDENNCGFCQYFAQTFHALEIPFKPGITWIKSFQTIDFYPAAYTIIARESVHNFLRGPPSC